VEARLFRRSSLAVLAGLFLFASSSVRLIGQTSGPATGLINRDPAVFVQSTGKIYLVDSDHDALIMLPSSRDPLRIKVGERPNAVAVNQKTGRIYVVNAAGRSVSILDTHTDQVIATVPTAARPYAIAVDEIGNKVYVSNTFSSMLTIIDGESGHANNLKAGSADAILVDSDRKKVYLLGYESDTVTQLDPATGAMEKLSAGAMHLWGMARAGKTLYISHVQDAAIAAIDLATGSARSLPAGAMPCAIAVSKSGQIYVANYADGTVTIINDGVSSTLTVAAHPQALTLDEDAGLLYVASPQQDAVTLIDTRTRRILQRYQDPDHPYGVAFSPVTHQAYAVNQGNTPFTPLKRP
jgi:YVTN family beta-propeller protein